MLPPLSLLAALGKIFRKLLKIVPQFSFSLNAPLPKVLNETNFKLFDVKSCPIVVVHRRWKPIKGRIRAYSSGLHFKNPQVQFALLDANQIGDVFGCLDDGDPGIFTVGVPWLVSDPNNGLENDMKTYEQLRYFYLSNIACGDIGETDQAAMLAELEAIKASMQNAEKR